MAKNLEVPEYLTTGWVRQKTANEGRSFGIICLVSAAVLFLIGVAAEGLPASTFLGMGACALLLGLFLLVLYLRGHGVLRLMLLDERGQELLAQGVALSHRQEALDRGISRLKGLTQDLEAARFEAHESADFYMWFARRRVQLAAAGEALLEAQLDHIDFFCRHTGEPWPFTCQRPSMSVGVA